MGHGQRLLEWLVGENHRQCHQEIRYTATQTDHHEQMLRSCWRRARIENSVCTEGIDKKQGLYKPAWYMLIPHILYNKHATDSRLAGLSRQAIFNAVEASLTRLQTHYLDLLQIHRFDPSVSIEETMEALHDLVKSGKVRYIGASSMWAHQFAMMQFTAEKHGWTKFVSMQNHYNLLYREEEREMNKFCDATGVGLIPVYLIPFPLSSPKNSTIANSPLQQWAPLCRGHLARPPTSYGSTTRSAGEKESASTSTGTSETDLKIIGRVQEIAEKRGWKMSHVALAWINKRIASPIIGCSSVERMEEAMAVRGKVLTSEEEAYLEELYEPRKVIGHS